MKSGRIVAEILMVLTFFGKPPMSPLLPRISHCQNPCDRPVTTGFRQSAIPVHVPGNPNPGVSEGRSGILYLAWNRIVSL